MINFIKQNAIELSALFVSIMALLYSFKTHNDNKKTTQTTTEKTLNKEFFEKIYFKYMIEKLPDSLYKLESKSGNAAQECDDMKDLILEILDKSIFYKYFDEAFYNKIKIAIINLEDELFEASTSRSDTIFREHRDRAINLTKKLYEELRTYYSGMS
ncbi:MAG: hypothetical protein RR835_05350 [Peptostreptococcaceae bacterium]